MHMREPHQRKLFWNGGKDVTGLDRPEERLTKMIEKHRHLLIKFRDELSSDLLVDDVLAFLQSKFSVNSQDVQLIRSEKTSKLRAEKLLDILPTKGYEAFHHFYDALIEKYPHLAELLKSGVNEERYGAVLDGVDSPTQLQRMSPQHQDLLTIHRIEIVEDLLVNDILNYLQSKLVFDSEDIELIKAEITSRRQVEKLLDLLTSKGDSAFFHFWDSLKDVYPHLAELFEDDSLDSVRKFSDARELQEKVESILLEGGVPQRPAIFTNRGRDVHRVRTALRSLQDRDGWVILHGMAGCGKTVLAAEALRHPGILEQCFPGGIFWIRIGSVDQPKLLMMMQNLCARLDSDHVRPPPRNVDEAKDRLRVLFAQQHPRSLLVLDDLWSENDIRYFDVRCRIMVTTRDMAVTDRVAGNKTKVRISEGFTEEESLRSLALWTEQQVTDLPPEAKEIVEQCKGSPLAISMIGALLKSHPNRWDFYLQRLKRKQVSKLKAHSEYPYPSLYEALLISFNNLDDDLREYYKDFALFDEESQVPAQVLCILWNEEFEEVEDLMDSLVGKSLARKITTSADTIVVSNTFYSVHNLQLTFLQEQCGNTESLHKKLVERYRTVYKGNFYEMIDDGYIHWNLVRHMLKAGLHQEALALLVNLMWITAKLQVTGPADLLSEYIYSKEHIKSMDRGVLDDFHHFISTNAHLLVEKPLPDLIQLALSEPTDSEVYKQALEEATRRAGKGDLYLKWRTQKEQSKDSCLITVKVHGAAAVHSCQFAQDGNKVVSCGRDNKIKVWECQSGKELLAVVGHTDVVYHCCLSHDEYRIASCSADHTVRVFNSGSGKELLTYKGHTDEVLCCAFSPDDRRIVSCSADKTVKVWDSETGTGCFTCSGHTDTVRWCTYSPDGTRIASCSDDSTVKVWDADAGEELFSLIELANSVSYCRFLSNGKKIIAVSDASVKVWDLSTTKVERTWTAVSTILSLAFSKDESLIAVALSDTTVQLWDMVKGVNLAVYHGHTAWVHCVAFSSDSTRLVTSSADETLKIWTVETSVTQDVRRLRRVFDVSFVGDSLEVAVTDTSNRLLVFAGEDAKLAMETECQGCKIRSIAFSNDGQKIATACDDGVVKVIEKSSGQVLHCFKEHHSTVRYCVFSGSDQKLLSASRDGTAKLASLKEKASVISLEGHKDAVIKGVFFDDDKKVLTASSDGTLKVWDSETGNVSLSCEHSRQEYIVSCDVSQDEKLLVSASADRFAKVWDSQTGQLKYALGPHPDVVRSATFSPDNKFLSSGCDDGTIRIWDLSDGKEVAVCSKHDGWVTSCCFSPDTQTLVSVSDSVQWWKHDGSPLQQFRMKGISAKDIHCSPDFRTFVTIDDIGNIYVLKRI